MRALRVVGLDEDGETVICEDPETGDRFSVPADERLRAAARGDLTRLGQVQIELESQMRPREIQARIRSGASVEQVATSSGIAEQKVERYAYPVLLERTRTAEMAQRAHPVREDGPDVQTLGEVVAHTFGMRGHDIAETTWDSWRGDDGKWVVQLHWNAGRSDNVARWVFHPGAHGGTVAALDDHAADLLDPAPNRPLRTVRPVTELAREALELDQDEESDEGQQSLPGTEQPTAAAPQPRRSTTPSIPPLDMPQRTERKPAPEPEPVEPAEPVQAEEPPVAEADEPPMAEVEELPLADPEEPAAESDEQRAPESPRRGRKNHPIVPSWEDVLLGVRSHR